LTIRFRLEVGRRVHCASGLSFMIPRSSGTVTSEGNVTSNLPEVKASMRVALSGMIVYSMPSR